MNEFISGFFATLKPIGIIVAAIAVFSLTIWALSELVWRTLADNSKWALLILVIIGILAVCSAVGGANFLYHNLAWKA